MFGKLIATALFSFALNSYADISIKVNIPSYNLSVHDATVELASFPIRVGNKESQTPIGKGKITKKRKRVVFRYLEGEKIGQVITLSRMNPTGEVIKMPYERLRGMDLEVNGLDTGKVFHSTTDYWTISFPKSHGCIGLNIEDMLKLYGLVEKTPTPVELEYETLFVKDGMITFWADIYNRRTNTLERLTEKGVEIQDATSAQNRLNLVDQELRYNLARIMKKVRVGKDARLLKHNLKYVVSIEEFLQPCYPHGEVITASIIGEDGFIDPLLREEISFKTAYKLANTIQGLDYKRLHDGDVLTLFIEGKEIIKFEYKGKQGEKSFELRGKNVFVE